MTRDALSLLVVPLGRSADRNNLFLERLCVCVCVPAATPVKGWIKVVSGQGFDPGTPSAEQGGQHGASPGILASTTGPHPM